MAKKVFQIIVLILILVSYGFFIADKINLVTADLGRHLKNGELILKGDFRVLNTNFYSYLYPDYPFVNHHWLAGVIFYLIKQVSGFSGLSWFYVLLGAIAFFLVFKLSKKNNGFVITLLTSILLIPLIAERTEIRPEGFSYLFLAIFFWILWKYQKGEISSRWLIALPIISAFWVNIHIYFIFGLFIIGAFLLERLVIKELRTRKEIKNLILVSVFTFLSYFINPLGLKIILYPLNIFREYGYKLVENQSVWFLEKLDFSNPNLLLLKVVFGLMILSFIFVLIFSRKKFSLILVLIGGIFGIMAMFALRNFTLFGLFALFVIAYNLKAIFERLNLKAQAREVIVAIAFIVVVLFSLINNYQKIIYGKPNLGFGLLPQVNGSADFFIKNNIKGPIFNNYDIGGYLIYHLFPREKVFVDNRPETYPVSFFKDIYIPMQENEEKWKEQDRMYNFNAIFFSYRDYTPWGQNFLINRINDSEWAPVFADFQTIIFLKKNESNKLIIGNFEIPKDYFKITKPK